MVNAKALQRLHIEVLEEFLVGCLLCKHPVVEFEGDQTSTKIAFEIVLASSVVEHFLGLETAYELLHIVISALACQKFTCRDIEESDATRRLTKMDCCQEVVLLIVQHRILHSHTRRHQFCDASFDQFFGQLRIFQLVADGHTLASTDELRQIRIQRMMGKSCHLVAFRPCPIVTMGQRDT